LYVQRSPVAIVARHCLLSICGHRPRTTIKDSLFLAKYLLERASDGLFIKSVQDNVSFKVNLNLLDTLSKCDISAAGPGDFRVTHHLENRNPKFKHVTMSKTARICG